MFDHVKTSMYDAITVMTLDQIEGHDFLFEITFPSDTDKICFGKTWETRQDKSSDKPVQQYFVHSQNSFCYTYSNTATDKDLFLSTLYNLLLSNSVYNLSSYAVHRIRRKIVELV